MKHLVSILFIGLIVGLSSCQSEIEQADSLRLQNKFDEAAKLYQKLSDEGNAYAMWRLSIAYSNGDGVDFDQEKALTLLKNAAGHGCEEAKGDLAEAYMLGQLGIVKDTAKGKNMLEKLVNKSNNSYIQSKYAGFLLFGPDDLFEKNPEKGLRILKEVKDKTDPYYLYIMGGVYMFGIENIDKDLKKSIEYYTKSFEKGKRYSSCIIADILFTKKYKDVYNRENGIEWLKKGVESNSTEAMLMLSKIYLVSEEDMDYNEFKSYRNIGKGLDLLQKAANHGDGEAYWRLGNEYYYGENVDKDDNKFFEYSKKSFELGYADGANNLGAAYMKGIGCKKDIKKAIAIWEKAVKFGCGYTAYNLYRLFRLGVPNEVPINYDREKAKYYLLQGAKLNDPSAWIALSFEYYPGGDLFEQDSEQAYVYAKKAADAGDIDGCERVAYLLDKGIGCKRNPQKAQEYRVMYEVNKNNEKDK